MQKDKSVTPGSPGENVREYKGDNDASTATMEHFEIEPAPHLHLKTYLLVAAVSFLSFATFIQLVTTGVFASAVAEATGGVGKENWMLASLTLTFVVFSPPVSRAGDLWGRRWPLIILSAMGCIGTLITSRAHTIGVAILGEVLVGAAFASTPLQFAVASEVLPRRQRLSGQACINMAGGSGSIFVLLAGGKMLDVYGVQAFRYIYYINSGVFAIGGLICFAVYRPPPLSLQKSLTQREKLGKLDLPGYVLLMFAVVLTCMGLSWANNPYPWNDAHVLAPMIIGLILFGFIGIYCWKIGKNSFIPPALFSRDRNAAICLFAIFIEGLVFAAANLYVPAQSAILYEKTRLNVSLVFTVVLVCYVGGSPIVAWICYRFKILKILSIAGYVCLLAWAICMATTTLGSRTSVWGYQPLLGAALALIMNAVVSGAQLSAPPELMYVHSALSKIVIQDLIQRNLSATTSGLIAGLRSLGVTIGVAIYTAVFSSRFKVLLPAKVAQAALQSGLPESSLPALILGLATNDAEALAAVPGVSPTIITAASNALRAAYLGSFRAVWITASSLTAAGLFATFFLADAAQDLNNHIDNPGESEEALYSKK
ncbi:hypothetical protein LTR84_003751 [Exophiala bonariae]|uniref:Major facilitator superfamily (MFS) profile domain-containing protein n=1 Tax=Exophiala bonariae TaxID=1690606 RepID=A0AAV9N648_9EURO|nr:hypothetical protein LTR84_003751 [Exophiala bonariae]